MDDPKPRPQPLAVGDPAPWFVCRTRQRADYSFATVAGRYIVLTFLGSSSSPHAPALLEAVRAARERFNDEALALFVVTTDAADADHPGMQDMLPGIRFFWDFDRAVSALYGALATDGAPRALSYVLDPALRVIATLPIADDAHFAALAQLLDRLPPLPAPELARAQAPVLVLPRVFEPALCRELIAYYDGLGGIDSGFMQEREGRTRGVIDYGFKRRRDREIEDERLRTACMARVHGRLAPEIHKAFQFRATRMERYIVSCYDSGEGGFFRAHRDNTTRGTAHRRFAVSLFLNSDYEGGYLRFPEYGAALYRAGVGGAVVFGCSMLHEATPVTRGRRYMFLPFLYDDEAARIREANQKYLDNDVVVREGPARS